MKLPAAHSAEHLLVLSDNRERISEVVAYALDERGWLPDEIVVLVLRDDDPLGAQLSRRWRLDAVACKPAVGVRRLEDVSELYRQLGQPEEGLEPIPEHGCVRVLLASGGAPVLAHAQYVTAANHEQWQRRLYSAIDRVSTRIAGTRRPRGPLS